MIERWFFLCRSSFGGACFKACVRLESGRLQAAISARRLAKRDPTTSAAAETHRREWFLAAIPSTAVHSTASLRYSAVWDRPRIPCSSLSIASAFAHTALLLLPAHSGVCQLRLLLGDEYRHGARVFVLRRAHGLYERRLRRVEEVVTLLLAERAGARAATKSSLAVLRHLLLVFGVAISGQECGSVV